MSSHTPVVSNPPRLQGQVRLLLEHIESQGLQGGDRLEPERELAKILGISRPSLREAIQILQVQGRLRVKHGIGIFILDQADGEKLRESLRAAQHRIEELFQMREILEAPAVEWAAERRSEEQLAERLAQFVFVERFFQECQCAQLKAVPAGDGIARVQRETKGRGGKAVTVVRGLALDAEALVALAKRLKAACGSGGTIKDGQIEVQGEHGDKIVAFLQAEGFKVKRSGG